METIQKSDINKILEKLAELHEDVNYIKEYMLELDNIMTDEDKKDFDEYEREKNEGKLISEEQLKKELGL